MGTCLYYYTGTGNSLWVARQLAAQLPDAELVSLNAKITVPTEIDSERIGIVTEKNPGYARYHHPEVKLADMLPR